MATMPPILKSGTADVNGTATVTLQDPAMDYSIEQISVSTGGTQGIAKVYRQQQFLIGTNQGWADSADGPPAIPLSAGEILSVVFSGVGAGVACFVSFYGQQLPRGFPR